MPIIQPGYVIFEREVTGADCELTIICRDAGDKPAEMPRPWHSKRKQIATSPLTNSMLVPAPLTERINAPVPPGNVKKGMTKMNARLASVDIRYPHPDSLTVTNGFKTDPFYRLLLSIQTENIQMELIQAGQADGVWPAVYRPVHEQAAQAGWMWAIFSLRGDPLGFVTLNASPTSPDFDCYYGPHLDIACRRDGPNAAYVPEAIAGLLTWLLAHDICFVVHADHAQSDRQLGDWLIGAGFLYTGCRSPDGRRQMICLL